MAISVYNVQQQSGISYGNWGLQIQYEYQHQFATLSGDIYVSGGIGNGGSKLIGILPTGKRPTRTRDEYVHSGPDSYFRIKIQTNGCVYCYNYTGSTLYNFYFSANYLFN